MASAQGRVALVTGGTRGIGEAISIGLKNAGRFVVANYAGNEHAASDFKERTGIAVKKFDVSDFSITAAAIREIEADVGAIHDGKGALTTPLALSRENSDSSIGSASSTSASVDSVIPGYNNTSTDSPFSASKAATPHRAVQNDGGELEQFNDISFWRAARPSYVLPE